MRIATLVLRHGHGFLDAHVHPVQGDVERLRCDLTALGSREDYLAAVRAFAEAHPDRPWVLGGGWAMPGSAAVGPPGPTRSTGASSGTPTGLPPAR